mgnify:CR=1 FL=1
MKLSEAGDDMALLAVVRDADEGRVRDRILPAYHNAAGLGRVRVVCLWCLLV